MENNTGQICGTPHCWTKLNIYRHWVYCKTLKCIVCEPVLQQIDSGVLRIDSIDNNEFLMKIPRLLEQHHVFMISHCLSCKHNKDTEEVNYEMLCMYKISLIIFYFSACYPFVVK